MSQERTRGSEIAVSNSTGSAATVILTLRRFPLELKVPSMSITRLRYYHSKRDENQRDVTWLFIVKLELRLVCYDLVGLWNNRITSGDSVFTSEILPWSSNVDAENEHSCLMNLSQQNFILRIGRLFCSVSSWMFIENKTWGICSARKYMHSWNHEPKSAWPEDIYCLTSSLLSPRWFRTGIT